MADIDKKSIKCVPLADGSVYPVFSTANKVMAWNQTSGAFHTWASPIVTGTGR